LGPRTFTFWWWWRHYRAADSPNAVVDGGCVGLHLIITRQVKPLDHALNVSFRKKRANVRSKARRFSHCASQVLDYTDAAVSFVNSRLLLTSGYRLFISSWNRRTLGSTELLDGEQTPCIPSESRCARDAPGRRGICCSGGVAARNRLRKATVLQAVACREVWWTSLIRPVSTSKIKPRTGTSLAIHGCDRTFLICSRVCCSGSL